MLESSWQAHPTQLEDMKQPSAGKLLPEQDKKLEISK